MATDLSDTSIEEDRNQALHLLRESLLEAQTTVRGYDTKAQIVGVGYIFALGIVSDVGKLAPDPGLGGIAAVIVGWSVVILPILLFGHVLYPTRKSVAEIDGEEAKRLTHLLYIDPERMTSVRDIRDAALGADPLTELSFELLKVSKLRELKRQRFLKGLFTAALAFLFLFASQVLRSQ